MSLIDPAVRPCVRTDGLVVTRLDQELLVYELQSHTLNTLNQAATIIWDLVDGTRSIEHLVQDSGQSRELVELALRQMADANLLDQELPAPSDRQSRRRALKRAAVIAVPAIVSVTAPAAAHQGSQTCGQPCPGGKDRECRGYGRCDTCYNYGSWKHPNYLCKAGW